MCGGIRKFTVKTTCPSCRGGIKSSLLDDCIDESLEE